MWVKPDRVEMKKTTSELLGRALNNSVQHYTETIDVTPMHARKQSEVHFREARNFSTIEHSENQSSDLLFDPSKDGKSENKTFWLNEDPSGYRYDSVQASQSLYSKEDRWVLNRKDSML